MSASDSQIRDYVRRPKLYENIDGTGELAMGIMYLGFWLGSYLEALMPADSFWGKGHPGHLAILLWMGLVIGAMYSVPRTIKRHITFPRTGYVAQRCGKRKHAVSALAAAVFTAAIGLTFFVLGRGHHIEAGRIAFLVCIVGPYVLFAVVSRDHPWKWALAAGLGLFVTGMAFNSGFHQSFLHPAGLITGLVWLASGGITLLLYIRRTHPPEPEAQ